MKVRDFKIREIRRITWQISKLSTVKWNYFREETILGNKEGNRHCSNVTSTNDKLQEGKKNFKG